MIQQCERILDEKTPLHLSVKSSNMDSLTADAEWQIKFGNHTTPLEGSRQTSVTVPQDGSHAEMKFPGGTLSWSFPQTPECDNVKARHLSALLEETAVL